MMMYSYRHGFSGFAAKLTNSQAKQIGELPDVVRVIKNPLYTTHTSRSWDFLGLSRNSPNNLLNKTNQGDGMIIGVLDSEMMAVYCSGADILAGVDDAIKDGVDIISASIGDIFINIAEVNEESVLGIGSYHAVSHGISVIAAGGNSGPDSNTISNTAPWVITVAASNSDRHIVTPLTLGNNNTILGDGLFREQIFGPLITFHNITKGEQVKFIANEVKGKVLLVFFQQEDDILASLINLKTSGVLAIIVSIPPFDEITDYNQLFGIPIPNVYVDLEQGNQIYDYFQRSKSNNQDPMIKLGRSEILEGQEVVLKVPKFSSRGPNAFAPEILKPDIAAPGVNILAAVRPQKGDHGFQLMSGTSMAAPHVSGIVALLKVAHPDWSPAAIKSALVTTAWNEDTYKSEIYSEGAGDKIADPFDFGGGICNPNGATDPGLVYDMDKNDYLNYLCSLGYSNDKMQNATTLFSKTKNSTSSGIICPNKVPSRSLIGVKSEFGQLRKLEIYARAWRKEKRGERRRKGKIRRECSSLIVNFAKDSILRGMSEIEKKNSSNSPGECLAWRAPSTPRRLGRRACSVLETSPSNLGAGAARQ
uniref:Cucumisin n=1 Tax=Solanum tuberosum TaxID=4113 RepID=M1BPJ1_SOLTU